MRRGEEERRAGRNITLSKAEPDGGLDAVRSE